MGSKPVGLQIYQILDQVLIEGRFALGISTIVISSLGYVHSYYFFLHPQSAHLILALSLDGGAGIRIHVSRVAMDWDLSDALSTELHHRGCVHNCY